MKAIANVLIKALPAILASIFIISCSTIPVLKVNYRLPPPSDRLAGQKIYLQVEDARSPQVVFEGGAKEEYKNSSDSMSFSVARHNETSGFRIGLYKPLELFKGGFERRLENDGIVLVSRASQGVPELRIIVRAFSLDLKERKWIAKMVYEAGLVKDGKTLSTQTISGQAEQVKVMGRGGADKAMGEIFTDMVNRLDLARLFQQVNV